MKKKTKGDFQCLLNVSSRLQLCSPMSLVPSMCLNSPRARNVSGKMISVRTCVGGISPCEIATGGCIGPPPLQKHICVQHLESGPTWNRERMRSARQTQHIKGGLEGRLIVEIGMHYFCDLSEAYDSKWAMDFWFVPCTRVHDDFARAMPHDDPRADCFDCLVE